MGSGVLKRGDVLLFAIGKPRPGVIVQADEVNTRTEILVCPFTSSLIDAPLHRPTIYPSAGNGLTAPSQLMTDKVGPVPRSRLGTVIGRLDTTDILRLDIALVTVLDLGS